MSCARKSTLTATPKKTVISTADATGRGWGDQEAVWTFPRAGMRYVLRKIALSERDEHVCDSLAPVIGNRNSKLYHLPVGCPSYARVAKSNRIEFSSAADAEAAGFKLAGNCR